MYGPDCRGKTLLAGEPGGPKLLLRLLIARNGSGGCAESDRVAALRQDHAGSRIVESARTHNDRAEAPDAAGSEGVVGVGERAGEVDVGHGDGADLNPIGSC